MSFLEIAIIYLSIGAAFAVHGLLTENVGSFRRSKATLSGLMLWPVHAVSKIASFSVNSFGFVPKRIPDSLPQGYSVAKRELEDSLSSEIRSDELFRLRDSIARYTGLTLADKSEFSAMEAPVLQQDQGSVLETQAICLSRRNRNKLRRHRMFARMELVESIVEIISRTRDPEKSGAKAINFVKLLNDAVAETLLRKHVDQLQQARRTISVPALESTKWRAREHQPT